MSASTLTPVIVPQGGGTVSITLTESGTDDHYTYEVYTIAPTANAGYRLNRIEWVESYEDLWNGGTVTESHTSYAQFNYEERHNTDDYYHYGNYTLVSVTAYFDSLSPEYTITLTADPEAGGTLAGGGQYDSGDSCTVSATPAAGYYFVGWYEWGTKVSGDNPYTFMVSGDRSLTGRFHLKTNLLINTYSKSTPVQLVYDPETNLLVADY